MFNVKFVILYGLISGDWCNDVRYLCFILLDRLMKLNVCG